MITRYILLSIITVIAIGFTPDRYIQHLLAAIVIPQIYIDLSRFHLLDYLKNGYLIYVLGCFNWEFHQFIIRGFKYFQIDQILYDIAGIALSYIIFKFMKKFFKIV